ncbi:hypothetical protein IscW_ISCW004321, partial [Ixodes scapularis]
VEDPDPCETEDDDMDEEPRSTGAELAFSNFVAVDDDVPTCNPQTVADIVAELRQGQVTRDEHNDNKDEDEPETPPRATFTQAIAALDVLRSYFATKDNPAAEGGLKTLQTELFLPKGQGARQQKLTDVFGSEFVDVDLDLCSELTDEDIVREVLQQPEMELHNLQYATILCDGDSKAFKHIDAQQLYDKEVSKENCVNHVAKRVYAGLEKVKKANKGLGGMANL